jgi:ubiquinone/menaquinone biosynthesis C-methylase UbiE
MKHTKHLHSVLERDKTESLTAVDTAQKQSSIRILKRLKLPNKSSALSISTGSGYWDYLALKNNKKISKIVATDIVDNPVSKEDISLIKKYGIWTFKKIKPEKRLPFRSNTFDLVYHYDVIEHVNNPSLFLKEQFRVLKPNGYIIFSTPNLLRPANLAKLLLGKLTFPTNIGNQEKIGNYIHIQEFTEWNLLSMVKEAGFKDLSLFHVYFGLHQVNLTFEVTPKTNIGKTLCQYITIKAQKPSL